MKKSIAILYCPKCGWMMRAAWMAQELLTTFADEVYEISLRPSAIAGVYKVLVNEEIVFDRKEYGGFPEPKALKKLLRDLIASDKSLGHADEK